MVNYYSIPAENETAVNGCWKGPAGSLQILSWNPLRSKNYSRRFRGFDPNVIELIEETGFPGMKILEFGLDGPIDNPYLLHNFKTSM